MANPLLKTAYAVAFSLSLCFAQDAPPKLAVYVSGASGGINKSLSGKLLSAMSQSGKYAEIADPALLQDELASSGKSDLAYIAQAAKRRGAEYVCVVGMTEALGAYAITARLAKVSDLQVPKTGTADRAIKSLDDLTAIAAELARQLLPPGSHVPSPPSAELAAVAAPAAATGQCDKTYNINEVLFKVRNGFPAKLKDCSSTLAKDMLNPFGKKLEPKSFMTQCAVGGIEKEIPADFPNKDRIVGRLTDFVQELLNSASSGGVLDPKKLASSVGNMDIDGLLGDIKKLADNECVVDEPYEPPAAPAGKDGEEKKEKSALSFGIRAGINLSHTYSAEYYGIYDPSYNRYIKGSGNYGSILGMQLGVVLDIEMLDWFSLQPGLMYIQKGMEDVDGTEVTAHYLELPLLLSFKFSSFRFNVGTYIGLELDGLGSSYDYGEPSSIGYYEGYYQGSYDGYIFNAIDIGLSTGLGFERGMFYIGVFYDYGLQEVNRRDGYNLYNRTLGLNLGINL